MVDGKMRIMANCPVCGTQLLHYENPPRDKCPNIKAHDKLIGSRKKGPRPGTGTGRKKKK